VVYKCPVSWYDRSLPFLLIGLNTKVDDVIAFDLLPSFFCEDDPIEMETFSERIDQEHWTFADLLAADDIPEGILSDTVM